MCPAGLTVYCPILLSNLDSSWLVSFLLRQLESPDLTLIRAAAVILLPEEKSVDKPVWPVPHSVEVPAPVMGGKSASDQSKWDQIGRST